MPPPSASLSTARLHCVEAGAGPTVVCLHSSGSSSGQWRRLMESGAPGRRWLAFDFHGHGRSPAQPPHFDLGVESAAVWSAIASVREPVHLVGHSYGGAIAVDLALRHPGRIASLTVYEPVLFTLIDPRAAEFAEVTAIGRRIVDAADAGDLESAAARFIDYWNGAGAWRAMPLDQQQRARERMVAVARHFDALFGSGLTLERLQALRVPTLLLHGDRSPAASQAVCARLATLGGVAVHSFRGLGHMGPLTHPAQVNPVIVSHLDARASVRAAA